MQGKWIVLSIVLLAITQITKPQIIPNILSLLNPSNLFNSNRQGGDRTKIRLDKQDLPVLARVVRTADGSNNNVENPQHGKSFTFLSRLALPAYADGKEELIERGNPRALSNIIAKFQDGEEIPDNRHGLNMLFLLFGQFIDHDIDLTFPSLSQRASIKVPPGDPTFDAEGTGNKTITFTRSKFQKVGGIRFFKNQVTQWIDASVIYGSNDTIQTALRSFKNGKLKIDDNLPPKDSNNNFLSGDVRTNQNIGLTSIIIIFLRQHNRQCDLILAEHDDLNDQEIFQMARNKIAGFIQKITFKDFLPLLLGQKAFNKYIGQYQGYDEDIDPTINIEFTTAAYRIGHALLSDSFDLYNYENQAVRTIQLKNMFLSFLTIKQAQHADFVLNGIMRQACKQRSSQIVNGVRNLLVQTPKVFQDLFALNIQRGRDHGIPDFNTMRKKLGLKALQSFQQLTDDQQTVLRMRKAYQDDIDDFDMYSGILSQKSYNDGNLGQLASKIVGETFRKLRDGDRFWYQHAYPQQIIDQIQETTISDLIARNTKLKLPKQLEQHPFFTIKGAKLRQRRMRQMVQQDVVEYISDDQQEQQQQEYQNDQQEEQASQDDSESEDSNNEEQDDELDFGDGQQESYDNQQSDEEQEDSNQEQEQAQEYEQRQTQSSGQGQSLDHDQEQLAQQNEQAQEDVDSLQPNYQSYDSSQNYVEQQSTNNLRQQRQPNQQY